MAEMSDVIHDPIAENGLPHPEQNAQPTSTFRRSVMFWQAGIVVVGLIFVFFLAARLWQTKNSEQRASGEAPTFSFTTFEGEKISLEDLRGKGVVLNFWASWCNPCREEAVMLEETWQREKENNIVFIGLDYLDQEPAAKAYLQEFAISYANGPDLRSQAARVYGIKGVPETFFIDSQGKIAQLVIGPIVSDDQMNQYLAEIRP